jgi:hypothetical protein
MVLPGSERDQRRRTLPRAHPADQPRTLGQRHPKDAHPLSFRTRSRLPHAQRAARRPPKHCLLHRLKRLWHFTANERVDALQVQLAFVPHVLARLGHPRLVGLAIDWTFFDTTLPSGERMRYQVLRIAVPRKGRALPFLQLAYDRDDLSPNKSQNQIEQDALLAVVAALPRSVP